MYWDIVEVKPEPDYRLFVRFKDGLSGRVRLREEQLTGVLAPLRDARFFNHTVFSARPKEVLIVSPPPCGTTSGGRVRVPSG